MSSLFEYGLALLCLISLPAVIHALATLQASVSRALLCSRGELVRRIDQLDSSRTAARTAEAQALNRLERDLHDGPQQLLVRIQMDLARAERATELDPAKARDLLAEARQQTADTLAELRNLSRGIAPPVLLDRGLDAALEELAGRSDVLTTVDSSVGQVPPHIASAAYFTASEALTNVHKHSVATEAHIAVERQGDLLTISVTDNGIGGASIAKGHGLAGLAERVRGVEGELFVDSPIGGPTVVQAVLPCA